MANNWEILEDKCYKYLKKIYRQYVSIEPFGKSDSTKADIKIITANENEFFIEVKAGNSQCCQFVLFPNKETKRFDFSKRNKVPLSNNCKQIIAHMDKSYSTYRKVGKKGIRVDVDTSILYGLVEDFYSAKKVKFFMTEGTDLIIFPSDRFSEYFTIEAFYRKKPSGSSVPNEANNKPEILQGLSEENISGSLEFQYIGGETRCFIHSDSNLHKQKMICSNYTYQFKNNKYSKQIARHLAYVFEVRRLSNTSNPNVICQLSLKKETQDKIDLDAFKNYINQ